jgi:hypothetical protein
VSYVPDEWAVARNAIGTWLILGAPKTADGTQVYRVVWPLPSHAVPLAEAYGESAWTHPEFQNVIGAVNNIIEGIRDVGEYKPEAPFDLAAWVVEVEGVQGS